MEHRDQRTDTTLVQSKDPGSNTDPGNIPQILRLSKKIVREQHTDPKNCAQILHMYKAENEGGTPGS